MLPLPVRLYGLPVLGAGLFLAYDIATTRLYMGLAVVVPCVLAGIAMPFGRVQLAVNRDERRIAPRIGMGVPLFSWWDLQLQDFGRIWIRFEEASESESPGEVVALTGAAGDRALVSASDLLEARRFAEAQANCSGLGVSDDVTRSGYRESGTMNEPLHRRLRRQGGPPANHHG